MKSEKFLSSFSNFYPSFHFLFSIFPFTFYFPSFLLHFPTFSFFPFLFFPGRSAKKNSRSEVSGGTLPPAPLPPPVTPLITTACNTFNTHKKTLSVYHKNNTIRHAKYEDFVPIGKKKHYVNAIRTYIL